MTMLWHTDSVAYLTTSPSLEVLTCEVRSLTAPNVMLHPRNETSNRCLRRGGRSPGTNTWNSWNSLVIEATQLQLPQMLSIRNCQQ